MRLLICFLFFSNFLFAQKDKNSKEAYLKLTPLSILDFYNGPGFILGAEFNLSSYSSFHSDIGIQLPIVDYDDNWVNLKGFVVREEFRYHFVVAGSQISFIGFEGSFGQQTYTRTDLVDLYPLQLDSVLRYDSKRTYGGVVCNIGLQGRFYNGFLIEAYMGAGLRLNYVDCTLSEQHAQDRYFGDWNNPDHWIQKDGLNIIPKFNFGLRIGWSLRKK